MRGSRVRSPPRSLSSFHNGSAVTLDPTWLLISLIPSGAGFVLFVYGRKQNRWPYLVAGLLFIVYPYFTDTVVSLVGVGLLLTIPRTHLLRDWSA